MNKLIALYLLAICDILGWGIALTIFAPLMLTSTDFSRAFASLEIRSIFLGILFAVYPLMQFIAYPVMNRFAAIYGRKILFLITSMGSFIGFFLSAIAIWTNNFSYMFLSRIIAGFSAGNQHLIQRSIFELSPSTQRNKVHKMYSLITGLAFIIGPYLGGKLSDNTLLGFFAFSTPFLFLAILFFICFVLIAMFYQRQDEKSMNKTQLGWNFSVYKELFQQTHITKLLLYYFVCLLGWFYFLTFLPAYLFERYHFKQDSIGDHMGYLALSFAIGSFIVNYLRRKSCLHIKSYLISALVIACIFIYLISLDFSPYLLWIFIALCGFSIACWWGLFLQYIAEKIDGFLHTKLLGFSAILWSLALILAPIIAGFILICGSAYPLILSATFLLLAAIFQAFFMNKIPKNL